MIRFLCVIAASTALSGLAIAQVQLPLSMDASYVPGLQPTATAPAFSARAIDECDDFDRANGPMGPDWIVLGGVPEIVSDELHDFSFNSYAQHATGSDNYATAVITLDLEDSPAGGAYGAAVTGLGGGDNLYTKVQSNGGGGIYDTMGFYHGFNGGGAGGYGGFFTITPVVGGICTFYVTGGGDTMNIDIDENRDGIADYTYSASGILANVLGMGTDVGIGVWGTGSRVDDWNLNAGCASGPSISLTGSCPGARVMTGTGFTPGGTVYFGWGFAGAGTVAGGPCLGTPIGLINPQNLITILTADGAGGVTAAGVSSGGCGVISVMCFDVGTCDDSNTVVI